MARRALIQQLQQEDILAALTDLGDELSHQGFSEPVRMVVFGGVYMLFQVGNRLSTQDVDMALLDLPEMNKKPVAELSQKVQNAIQTVAKRRQIKKTWCNDDGAMFLDFAPSAEFHLWRAFNLLEVYLPSAEVILVLKFMGFREKDRRDVEALCKHLEITTRDQAQRLLNDYVDGRWQRDYRVERTLDELFE